MLYIEWCKLRDRAQKIIGGRLTPENNAEIYW